MSQRLAAGLLIGLLLAVLAGCGGDGAPKSEDAAGSQPGKPLTAGTCWDAEHLPDVLGQQRFDAWVEKYAGGSEVLGQSMRDDAAYDRPFACDEPHTLEIFDVVSLEPALLARVTSYADLLDESSPLYARVRDQVIDRCFARSPYGVAQRKAGGLPVQLSPSENPDGGLSGGWDPVPADRWVRGEKKFLCLFEQDRPGTVRFADITTSRYPLAARVCIDVPAKEVPCAGPHQAENIAGMVLNTAVESGRLPGRTAIRSATNGRYVALSGRDQARLDQVCQTFLEAVSTAQRGLTAAAYVADADEWPGKDGLYNATCYALEPGDPPPMMNGSVFDRG